MKLSDRVLLACVRWRLARVQPVALDAFGVELINSLANVFQRCGKAADDKKAMDLVITRIAHHTAALDEFLKLNAGEVARH